MQDKPDRLLRRNSVPLYFIAVECPTFRNSPLEVKAGLRVLPNHRGNGLDEERVQLLEGLCAERATTEEPERIVVEQLPPSTQIDEQTQQENVPPKAEGAQQPRPARRRLVLQELQIFSPPEERTRRRGREEPRLIVNELPIRNEPPQEEAQQARPRRERIAHEESQIQLSPERRTRRRTDDGTVNETGDRDQSQRQIQQLERQIEQQQQQFKMQRQQLEMPRQIPVVQNLIIEHQGENNLVETRRGMFHWPPEE